MIILAADTSTAINTVAVCEDEKILAEATVLCGRTHAERLIDTVTWVLREADLALPEVETLAVAIGPGSFTGLRVGLATWKGLALGQGLPLVGVPTLAAMARIPGTAEGVLCPVLDARMDEVFAAAYRFRGGIREQVVPDCVVSVETLADRLNGEHPTVFGDGVAAYGERIQACLPSAHVLPKQFWTPRAWAVAAEGLEMLRAGCTVDAAEIRPVYLRKSQAEQNRERVKGS